MNKNLKKLYSIFYDPHYAFNLRLFFVQSGINSIIFKGNLKNILYPSYLTDKNIQFIHVPKAAGTSIALAIYGRIIPHHAAKYYQSIDKARFKKTLTFAVVRDPIERFKSSFKFLINGGTKTVKVRNYSKYKNFFNDQDINRFITEWLPRQKKLDFTLMPQSEFICSETGDLLVDEIFDLSDLDSCKNFISKSLQKPIQIKKINSMNSHDSIKLSKHSLEILKNFYAKDYQFLNKHIGNIW